MTKQKAIITILAIGILLAEDTFSQEINDFKVKTYLFMGNSFVEKFQSKIDTQNYTSEIRFKKNQMVSRYYPNFGGDFEIVEKTEECKYNDSGKIEKITTTLVDKRKRQIRVDSIIYDYATLGSEYDIIVKNTGGINLEQRHKINGDTSLIDEYINGKYAYTYIDIKESKNKIKRQIVKPELRDVINTFYYDDFGHETRYEKTENGYTEVTLSIEYKLDAFNRIMEKKTFSEPEHQLMYMEIRVYE